MTRPSFLCDKDVTRLTISKLKFLSIPSFHVKAKIYIIIVINLLSKTSGKNKKK